jgi:hypothetical protein
VAAEVPLVPAHLLAGNHALAWDELEHLVDQKKGLAVRQDRLDSGSVEG